MSHEGVVLYMRPKKWLLLFLPVLFVLSVFWVQSFNEVKAASKAVTNAQIHDTLQFFRENVKGSSTVLKEAKGILVFPDVYQGGLFAFGGQYGLGGLCINNRVIDYYRIAGGSIGPKLGGQRKSLIIVFLTPQALQNFRNSSGWQGGIDASVAVITVGAEGAITTDQLANKPIVAFVLDQKGLMYNLSLRGTRIFKAKHLH
jgi:lipid-binding SYLF domain-containing protein